MSSARRITLVVLLAVAGAVALWFSSSRSSSMQRTAEMGTEPTSPEDRLAMLDGSLQAIAAGVRDAPRDRWDPSYVVARVGRNPDTLRQWVRENTVWIPYRGVLRGPVGVLMDRQGNSIDRALLLARLLTEAGHAARLALAELPAEQAWRELPALVGRRPGTLGESASPASAAAPVPTVAERYGLDGTAIERTLEGYEAGTFRLLSDLNRRTTAQTTRLLSAVAGPDPDAEWRARHDTAVASLQEHWWVQVKQGQSWIDLDLLGSSPEGFAPDPLVPLQTPRQSELDPSLFHSIAIRVIEERLAGGRLSERRTLEHVVMPRDVIGQPIVLQFWPTAWPNRAPSTEDPGRAIRQLALQQEAWSVALVIGGGVAARATLPASADNDAPAPGLGGLGGAIASGLGGKDQTGRGEPDSLLTAVWIEYRIDVPGRESRIARRSVFDLIGPGARAAWPPARAFLPDEGQRLTRSLSLMMRTEILPVAAQLAPEFVLHLGGSSLLANADLLRAVTSPGFGYDQLAADSLLRQSEPGVSPLYTLAVLRHDALGDRAFIDRPAILTRHQYPIAQGDSIAFEDATDIVANEIGVALGESDGFAARLAQGVWDTNLEALLGAGSRAAANTALAYDAFGDWRVLTSAVEQRPASSLPGDAAMLLQQDLDDGYTIVAPDAALDLDGEQFVGWWRIHPETGDALGIAGNGWGQAAPDYGMHLAAFLEMSKSFVFAYALCQYIPQAANSLNILGNEFWRLGISPRWTTRPEEGKDFEDVAVENNRRCVIDAILAGFVATAPLLMRTLAYRTEAELGNNLRRARRPGVTMPGMDRPPGTSPVARGNPAPSNPRAPGPGPRGTLPGGSRPPDADPLGKTDPALPRSRPGPPAPGAQPQNDLRKAAAAERAAKAKAAEATGDWVRYRYNMPGSEPDPRWRGDPSKWDQSADDILKQRMRETEREWYARQNELEAAQRAARDAAGAAQGARGRGGFPPPRRAPQAVPAANPAGCEPLCGNESKTMPQVPGAGANGALEVGSAGAASSFFPISWPSGLGQ